MSIAIGDRFVVSEKIEVKKKGSDGKDRHLCNFLPDFDYAVTQRNLTIVQDLVAAGKASIGTVAARARAGGALDVQSAPAKLRGSVRVGGKKK